MGDRAQSTSYDVLFRAYLASDHVTPATGKTIALTISKNHAAFGNPSGGATNLTEIANGWYYYTATTTDTNTVGALVFVGTASGVDQVDWLDSVVKATQGRLTAIPDTAATTNASLLTSGTGTDQISVASGKVLLQATQTGVTIPTVTNVGTLTTYTGDTPQTGDSYAVVNSGTFGNSAIKTAVGLVTAKLPANTIADETLVIAATNSIITAVGTPMQAYTQPTGFLAATFPTGTIANTTNITAGTITTTTNLTNAPTAGDLTATMKASVTSSVPTATAIVTAAWQDLTSSTDFTTTGSVGKALVALLANLPGSAFASAGVYSTAALANGPSGSGPTAAEIATQVWQDATSGDFTVINSAGRQLFAIPTSGSSGGGAISVTITVNDMNAAVIQNATVNLVVNSSRYFQTTNSSGIAVLTPTEGNATYTVQITANGYQFTPTTLVVSGATNHTYQMTAIVITPSSGSGVTMYGYTTDTSGTTIETGIQVQWAMSSYSGSGSIVDPTFLTVTSDGSSGLTQFVNCVAGATYRFRTLRGGSSSQWSYFVAISGGGEIASKIT